MNEKIKDEKPKFSIGKKRKTGKSTLAYLAGILFLAVLFFSNDFGLLDIQKTAIVLAVGIDREDEAFTVTAQIAVPAASAEAKAAAEAIQVQTKGDTVGAAIQKINEKTGWYPKLAFCNLIVLGESTTQKNVFEALDFFLRDDYFSDACNVCCCDGKASELLAVAPATENISSIAIGKILSDHAAKTAFAAPVSLHDFAKDHFGNGSGGFLPIVKSANLENGEKKPEKQDEPSGEKNAKKERGADGAEEEKKIFEATETALFFKGVRKGKLSAEETFALQCVKNGVRLASFDAEYGGANYTLLVRKSSAKTHFTVDENAVPILRIDLKLKAGLNDLSLSQTVAEIAAPEKTERGVLRRAEEKLLRILREVFEKARAVGCDIFDVKDRLQKYENAYFTAYKENVLERLIFYADVTFEPTR